MKTKIALFTLFLCLFLIVPTSGYVVGRTWNQSDPNPTLSSCFDANYTSESCPNFNTTDPWKSMGGVTINGQTMTQMKAFWYRVDNITVGGQHWMNFSISDTNISGFKLQPAFSINGTQIPYVYIGSFEASLTNTTPGYNNSGYNSGDFGGVNFLTDKLSSVVGVKPASGQNNTLSIINARTAAHNRGMNWEILNFNEVSAIQMMYLIEYGSFYSQSVLSNGVTGITDDVLTNMALPTGLTAGNISNSESGTNATNCGNFSCSLTTVHYQTHQITTPFSYRGIENFYGNMFKWVDGINIKADRNPWIADNGFVSNQFSAPYADTGLSLPTANGYASNIAYNGSFDWAFLPSAAVGSSSTYLTDYYYQATGNIAALLGGGWYSGAGAAGAFSWRLDSSASYSARAVGARLSYVYPIYANFTSNTSLRAVSFTDSSFNISTVTGVCGSPVSWSWSFGDGAVSSLQNPTHVYSTPGTYSVNLTVTGASGATATAIQSVTTASPILAQILPPGPTTRWLPNGVAFTDASTGSPTSWSWSFGDGTYSNNQNVTHNWTTAGTYTVMLNVSNGGWYSTNTTQVEIDQNSFISNPTFGDAPLVVQLTDTGYGSVSWSWDFGDWTGSNIQNPSHIYSLPGKYDVTLTATNSAGNSSVLKKVQYIIAITSTKFKNDYSGIFAVMNLIEGLPAIIGIGMLIYYVRMPKKNPMILFGGLGIFLSGVVIIIVMLMVIPYMGGILGG